VLVCPLLTVFVYYYLCLLWSRFYDDLQVDIVYYSLIVGLTLQFFILVTFSENWLVSTCLFAPCVAYFMCVTQQILTTVSGRTIGLLVFRILFQVLVYGAVAYKVELLQKQNFLGKDAYQKSFKHWLQIFDTFTEGVAVLDSEGGVVYANDSVRKHLQFDKMDQEQTQKLEPETSSIKEVLETTVLEECSQKSREKKELTVYDFVMSHSTGNMFELKATKVSKPDQISSHSRVSNDPRSDG
jgi:PAS domain-containing protein